MWRGEFEVTLEEDISYSLSLSLDECVNQCQFGALAVWCQRKMPIVVLPADRFE